MSVPATAMTPPTMTDRMGSTSGKPDNRPVANFNVVKVMEGA